MKNMKGDLPLARQLLSSCPFLGFLFAKSRVLNTGNLCVSGNNTFLDKINVSNGSLSHKCVVSIKPK